ncbi:MULTISPECIES: DUF3192 domain-containing protein [Shewanella]|jgi:hypothetical protein|uniref:Beta-barrel assembly machine subunit BamE n=1 Tax=Shewanella fodinae TaxID=552357 RepID=A0A4R2FEG3_9GAMM|nr:MULTISPECIES: DUF3192 domain-containing protein [Shewanella]MDN5368877.1 hypothetical protein [Shewanella sp.]MBO1270450.1 DUF3192 domain-containing protein [Shewanella sp. 4t3-1-2LB]MCL2906567.1 DUF3192 domain-containing protein [Shewanella fodinae]TCN87984.1 Beta-barrel assembly machine subunit BamE [Shewanella fodinae]GGZ02006.1 hypothetical protein GCM10007169_18580 [Shewanella fodinae]
MNKALFPLLGLASLGLTACVVNVGGDEDWHDNNSWQALQHKNQQLISQLELGMSQQKVQEIMGPADFSEAFMAHGEAVQVLYYRTQHVHSDGKTTKDECTPVIFKQHLLLGWGDKAYEQL